MKNNLETLISSTVTGVIAGKGILIIAACNAAGEKRQYMIQPVGGNLSVKVLEDEKTK